MLRYTRLVHAQLYLQPDQIPHHSLPLAGHTYCHVQVGIQNTDCSDWLYAYSPGEPQWK